MGQILVRNLDEDLIAKLKAKAAAKGQSLEQTAREALAASVAPDRSSLVEFAADMRARTATRKPNYDVVASIRHDRDTGYGREWV
jgi:plasmid stability protein